MAPAAEVMAEALAGVTIAAPAVPLVANVKAAAVTDPAEIRELLVAQVTGSGPLARVGGLDGGRGGHRVLGNRRRQGAVGDDPADRPRRR